MRIGLTYDLRDVYLARGFTDDEVAEFDSTETVQALERALTTLRHEVVHIGHVRNLIEQVARGDRWDLVFNFAEGIKGSGREAQVPAVLEAYEIPYTFSDPLVLSVCLHKGVAKRVARDCGVPTPDFAIVDRVADVQRVRLAFPLFIKPVAEGSSKGVSDRSLVHDAAGLSSGCAKLLERYKQPVLVEQYLPGREFTVGIAGTGAGATALGVMEIHLGNEAEASGYSRDNKIHYENRVSYTPLQDGKRSEAIEVALAAWRALGCRDAGRVDVRCNAAGAVEFMEVNPLAGLNPIHSDLVILCRLEGISYEDLIARIVNEAIARVGTP
jgi:D-alanine-D-alanine ligase